jgi:hypothetical protein
VSITSDAHEFKDPSPRMMIRRWRGWLEQKDYIEWLSRCMTINVSLVEVMTKLLLTVLIVFGNIIIPTQILHD